MLPRQLPELETAWLGYPLMIDPDAGFERQRPAALPRRQGHRHPHDLDGQRHPSADAGGIDVRVPADGLPNADVVMERGVMLPLSHALDDDTLDYVTDTVSVFLARG